MKIFKKYFVSPAIGFVLLLTNCNESFMSKSEEVEFTVYSVKISAYNNLYATVHVSDTNNWTTIAEFADSLVQGHGFFSNVLFYSDSNKVPILNDMYGFKSNVEPVASYKVPHASLIFERRKKINQSEDLAFKLINNNNNIYVVKNPYTANYNDVNEYISYHNNHEKYFKNVKSTSSKFINSMLKSKMDSLPNLFVGKMNKMKIQKLHDSLLKTEWDELSKSKGITSKKYNLWYRNYNFIKDFDTLKVKIHFDVKKSAEKIKSVEYSLR